MKRASSTTPFPSPSIYLKFERTSSNPNPSSINSVPLTLSLALILPTAPPRPLSRFVERATRLSVRCWSENSSAAAVSRSARCDRCSARDLHPLFFFSLGQNAAPLLSRCSRRVAAALPSLKSSPVVASVSAARSRSAIVKVLPLLGGRMVFTKFSP
ncbi:hypothetical protein AAHA92_02725 [Salvia divinorum]|uniref:Uncharacterized protein n=1 Tax=Salvia divinorum TaxID=28513 RepID=A0ABD1IES4_SALDI